MTTLPPQLADLIHARWTVVGERKSGRVVRAWIEEPCGMGSVPLTVEQYPAAALLARQLHDADQIEHVAVPGNGHVLSYGYRESDRTLEVTFRPRGGVGAVYRYFGVWPSTVDQLREAESKVLYVNSVIARSHKYTKVTDREPVRIINAAFGAPTLKVAG